MPMAVVRVLVLIQVGGRAAEGGFAALGTRSLRSRAPRQAHASTIKAIRQLIRAPEKDLQSKDFLGRGAETALFRQLAEATCPFGTVAAPLPKKSLLCKSFSGALIG